MAMPRPAVVAIAILAGIMALTAARAFPDKLSRKMPDFEVYWTAASRAHDAEPLYRPEDGHYQFKYLPAFAVLTAPAARVPLEHAKTAWFVISVLLLVVLLASSLSLLPALRRPAWWVVTATLVVMLKFYGHELILGQMNALFAVIVVSAIVALRRGREALAGALLSLAIVVKPYAILFAPWIVARRRAVSIAALGIGTTVLLALPALLYGVTGDVELHRAWWRTVTESTAPNLTNADNVSIAAMWAKWIGAGRLATVLSAASGVALLAAAGFVFLRRRTIQFPEGLEAALLLTCIPLLSPQGWDYVFLVATPAVMFVLNYFTMLPQSMRAAVAAALVLVGFTVYDIMGRAAYSKFMMLSVITVCFFMIVGALVTIRTRAAA
jgi:arabinofuranan 3-O-arabinosyltransferase